MLQLKVLWQCCLVLGITTWHQTLAIELPLNTTCAPENVTITTTCAPINITITTTCAPSGGGNKSDGDSLCENFQDLRAIIERDTLVEIIQTHYECDSKFRRAMAYYNTTQFRQVAEMLQHSAAYRSLLQELQNDGVDTSDIENIVDIIACIVLPVPKVDTDCDCKAVKKRSFMSDILVAMSKREVHDYMARARAKQSNFALLASALTSPEFQARLRANMVKRDMVRPMRILRRHGWDIQELLRGALTILSW